MRNYIWAIIVLGFIYLAWKGLEFYRDEQTRKNEIENLSHEKSMQERELKHDSAERGKDRELQREILKHQRNEENRSDPK